MNTLILASQSPRRRELLAQLTLKFEVQPSSVDEEYDPALPADEIARQLALRKAEAVASKQQREAVIIGSDTLVVLGEQILEKPESEKEAGEMLLMLSGRTHTVLTGVALCKVDNTDTICDTISFTEETKVTFSEVTPQISRSYIEHAKPFDKAGSYGIQDELSALFVKQIEGDYNNVVGFPLHAFLEAMESFAPEYLPPEWND